MREKQQVNTSQTELERTKPAKTGLKCYLSAAAIQTVLCSPGPYRSTISSRQHKLPCKHRQVLALCATYIPLQKVIIVLLAFMERVSL